MGACGSSLPGDPPRPAPKAQVNAQAAGPSASTNKLADDDEATAQRLFSACLQRDSWIAALEGTEPWHAERAGALMSGSARGTRTGTREQLHVHRSAGDGSHGTDSAGGCFVATVLSSAHAPPGEVMWQVDAREKTLTTFGEPGYGGLLLGTMPCVLLVEQMSEATVLYFYSGRICLLRCWRRSKNRSRSNDSSSQADVKQQNPRKSSSPQREKAHPREGSESRNKKRKQRSSGEEGSSKSAGGKSGGSKHVGKDGRSSSSSSRRSSSTMSSSDAASGTIPDVAAWARGKNLAILLSELFRVFGRTLPELPRGKSAAELSSSPAMLRKAYHRALLAVHPDKHVKSPPAVSELAVSLFHALSAAHAHAAAMENAQHVAC